MFDIWGNTLTPSLTIYVVAVPTLASSLPSSANVGSGTVTITLTGTNFVAPVTIGAGGAVDEPGTTAQWFAFTGYNEGSVPLTTTFTDASHLSVVIPAGLMTVPVLGNITVIQPDGSVSNALPFPVIGPTTTSAPTFSPSASVAVNTLVTMTSTVQFTGAAASGTVVFSENGNTIGSGLLGSNSTASYNTSTLAPGVHNIVATYGGNIIHAGSVSTASALTAIGAPSLSSLSPLSVTAGSSTFTLTVYGTNFLPGSPGTVAQWSVNGGSPVALSTTVANAGRLTATVPGSVLATAVQASITVIQPDSVTSNRSEERR